MFLERSCMEDIGPVMLGRLDDKLVRRGWSLSNRVRDVPELLFEPAALWKLKNRTLVKFNRSCARECVREYYTK